MKQTFLILVSLICIVAAYSIGRKSNPDTQAFSEKLAINAMVFSPMNITMSVLRPYWRMSASRTPL